MKCFIVLSALAAVALARPGHLLQSAHHVSHVLPVSYANLVPAAPIGHDGRVVDTPEVAHAKAEHLAAHAHAKAAVAHDSYDSAHLLTYAPAAAHVTSYHAAVAPVAYTKLVPAAPIGHDGRVVDTPEVAHAKAEHLAAHAHAKAAVAHDSYDSAHLLTYAPAAAHVTSYHAAVAPVAYTKLVPAAPIGHDGRVVDTPEVAHAKAEHLAAHAHEKAAVAHESHKSAEILTYAAAPIATSYETYSSLPVAPASYHGVHAYQAVAPVAYAKYVPAAPIGHDGRVVDTPEVAHAKAAHEAAHAHEKLSLAHEEAKSGLYVGEPQHVQLVAAAAHSYAPRYVSADQWW